MFGASVPFCLTAPPIPTLFGVFVFHHRRLPFITGVCTPSIRCLYNSSLSFLACVGKVFACCLHQEHKRLLVVQTLTVSALSFIWEHFFSLHLLSHYSTSLDPTDTLHNLRVPSCNFCSPNFSLFLAYVWQQLILSQHLSKSKIGCQSLSPCCIPLPLSGSSSILPSRNHSHRI